LLACGAFGLNIDRARVLVVRADGRIVPVGDSAPAGRPQPEGAGLQVSLWRLPDLRRALLESCWPPADDWPQRLGEHGTLLIHGVPRDDDNRSLRGLGARLGQPSLRAIDRRLDEGAGVQRVQALGGLVHDRSGKPLQSAGHGEFALHTDESFLEHPADFVLLHCWQAAPTGGTTRVADSRAIPARVDRVEWIAWTQLRLPYPCGERCSVDAAGAVRFNPDECAAALLSSRQQDWLARFAETARRLAIEVPLVAGDVLLLDNRRMLHGRSAFAAACGRLLKRLRIIAVGSNQP
jgi:alpha-ketoglutarate-dependent taurine dioxygenase